MKIVAAAMNFKKDAEHVSSMFYDLLKQSEWNEQSKKNSNKTRTTSLINTSQVCIRINKISWNCKYINVSYNTRISYKNIVITDGRLFVLCNHEDGCSRHPNASQTIKITFTKLNVSFGRCEQYTKNSNNEKVKSAEKYQINSYIVEHSFHFWSWRF